MNGGTVRYVGTSQASPTAAGIATLMLQARPALSPDALENTLKTTGVTIDDPRSAFEYPRVDALAAVQSVLALLATPVQNSPTERVVTGTTPAFTWAVVPDAEMYYFWLSHADGTKILNVWLNPVEYCDASLCTYPTPFPLNAGPHRWWIQAWSTAQGESPWSPMAVFEVVP
ncbi:MAG: S8 family serine peptidase [Chloroflexi bacterium]|nr:S8 family serine peptidase [Chloroflexota bacterium]